MVAKGYTQVEEIDFEDTISPVAKLVTIKTLIAVTTAKNWYLHQLDVNNLFLNGDLHDEVYMDIYLEFASKGEHRICRLHKSLYGLKQTSRQWFAKLTTIVLEVGYTQSQFDHTLFSWV